MTRLWWWPNFLSANLCEARRLCGLHIATVISPPRRRGTQRFAENTLKFEHYPRLFTYFVVALTQMNLPISAETQALVADTIIVNATVHTMDPARPTVRSEEH